MRRTILTLVVAAFVAAPALAQPGRQPGGFGGRGGQTGPLQLLANKSVADELKLTDDQKKKAEEGSKKVSDARRKMESDAGITFQNRREKTKELEEITKKLAGETDKALEEVKLTSDQSKRLNQIRVQQLGINAFTTADVQKALKLSDEQQTKVKEIITELGKKREDSFKDLGMDFTKIREAMTKFRETQTEYLGKVAATLSSDQKKTWKDLTGEKFEIKFEQRRPGGGGTRPGAGGGRPGGGRPGGTPPGGGATPPGGRPRTDLN